MEEVWYSLVNVGIGRVAVVLDVARSSSDHWPDLARMARYLIDEVVGPSDHGVYFLGSAERLPADRFATSQHAWHQQHQGRARLLGPTFEALQADPGCTVVVLGAGPLLDLADWVGEPVLKRTVFVARPGCTLTGGLAPELPWSAPDVQRVVQAPVEKVTVGGGGALPVWWDNAAYAFEDGGLIGRQTDRLDLRVGLLAQWPEQVRAVAWHTGREPSEPTLVRCAPVDRPWEELTAEEAAILRQCVTTGHFRLPGSSEELPADRLRVHRDPGSVLGTLIYPAVGRALVAWRADGRDVPYPGFVAFRLDSQGAAFRLHECCTHRLDESLDAVAVRRSRQVTIWRWLATAGRWQDTGVAVAPYHRYAPGQYLFWP